MQKTSLITDISFLNKCQKILLPKTSWILQFHSASVSCPQLPVAPYPFLKLTDSAALHSNTGDRTSSQSCYSLYHQSECMPSWSINKKQTHTHKPSNNTISSFQQGRKNHVWCCPSLRAPTSGVPVVSNSKHVATLLLRGRSRSQLPGELQHKYGVCRMIGWMDTLFSKP